MIRCGALHPGDQILAIGDVRLDGPASVDVQEVARLLRSNYGGDVVKLIVAPAGMGQRRNSDHGSRRGLLPPPSPRPSQTGTLRSRVSRTKSRSGRLESCSNRLETASVASSGQSGSSKGSCAINSPGHGRVMLSHPEWVTTTLQIDCRGSYGLALGRATDHEAPVVINVESSSPCDRYAERKMLLPTLHLPYIVQLKLIWDSGPVASSRAIAFCASISRVRLE